MLPLLADHADQLLLAPLKSPRTLQPEDILPFCQKLNRALPVHVSSSVSDALHIAAEAPLLVITGSLYLIGEALEALNLSPAPSSPERALNEYAPAR
jgi:dihydrofolate synthase / folylpolyglutamate synthase